MTVYLGLDPSLTGTGWCVLDDDGIRRIGKIKTTTGKFLGQRLAVIGSTIRGLVVEHNPDLVAFEGLGFNSDSLSVTAQVHGALRMSIARVNGRVYNPAMVAPTSLKKWATGDGRADKSQMIAAAFTLTGYRGRSHDEADAALIAAWVRHQVRVGLLTDEMQGLLK